MKPRGGLGDVLVEERLLAPEQLSQTTRAAERLGMRLVTILVDQGLVSEDALVDALRRSQRMELYDPDATAVDLDAVRQVPFEEADRYRLLPLQILHHGTQRVLRVAMADPLDRQAIEDIEFSTGTIVEPLIARPSQLAESIRHHYRGVVTRVMPRTRGQTAPTSAAPAPTTSGRRTFGGGLDDQQLQTRPIQQAETLASPAQRVDALVRLLVRNGVISRDDYEEQLQELVGPTDQEPG